LYVSHGVVFGFADTAFLSPGGSPENLAAIQDEHATLGGRREPPSVEVEDGGLVQSVAIRLAGADLSSALFQK